MDFAHAPRVTLLQAQMRRFLDDLVLPANVQWQRYAAAGVYPLDVLEPLNCSAPDTGNIELLHRFATPAQTERWLNPLLAGTMRSCFEYRPGTGRLLRGSAGTCSGNGAWASGSFSRASMIATPCMKNAPGPKQGAARKSPGLRAQGSEPKAQGTGVQMACGGSDSLVGGVTLFTSSGASVSLFRNEAANCVQAMVDAVAEAGTWLLDAAPASSGLSPQAASNVTAASSAREVLIFMVQCSWFNGCLA